MSNELAILARMRAAGVPPHAFQHTLLGMRQMRLAAAVKSKTYDLGHSGLASMIVHAVLDEAPLKTVNHSPTLVCGVLAKELVLQGRKVIYGSLASMVHATKAPDAYESLGSGYLVIPDLGQNISRWEPREWEICQDTMRFHISRGGGLIIGDTGVIEGGYFGQEMLESLSLFDTYAVE